MAGWGVVTFFDFVDSESKNNYHRYCKMDGSRFSLWHIRLRAFKKFNRQAKQDRKSTGKLIDKAFPSVPYSENKHIVVKRTKSPYDGDITYWSKRNSKLYDSETSFALKQQNHICASCGLRFLSDERIHLHHKDGNHSNWRKENLMAIHESCHHYLHMRKCESARISGAVCHESGTYGSK